jgi:hypothetical protein
MIVFVTTKVQPKLTAYVEKNQKTRAEFVFPVIDNADNFFILYLLFSTKTDFNQKTEMLISLQCLKNVVSIGNKQT